MKQTRALALLGSVVESPGMQGGSWWPYADNSAFQGILIYGPQVVLDVLMDGSCTDPSKIQNNNKSALGFNKNVLSVASATYTQQFYILAATAIVFVCLLVVKLQNFAHEDNQIYIGKLYGFQYTIPCNRQGSEGKHKHSLNLVIR